MSSNLGHVKGLPTMITSRLAPEIYDNILVNFHDSKHHLSNFSVVSNLWLSLCRYYLFAEVTYRANFSLFLALSDHAISTIAPYIRELKIDGNILTDIDKLRIMEFIFSLSNLRSLCFNNVDIGAMKLHHVSAEGNRYLQLELCSLNLRLIHFSTFGALTDFLQSFPALEELSLENVSWDRLRHIPDRQESAWDSALGPSSLRRLKIDCCDNITLLHWLQYGVISDSLVNRKSISHRSFSRLRAPSVADILPAETKAMNSFLSTLDNTLEKLEIGLITQYHTGPHNQVFPTIDLSSNSNLQTLVFHHITLFCFPNKAEATIETGYSNSDSPYMWIIHVLSTVKSSAIQTIGFHVWLSDESQLDILPWPIMDLILSDLTPRRLEFYIAGIERDIELVEGWFKKKLVMAYITGKITVTFRFEGLVG